MTTRRPSASARSTGYQCNPASPPPWTRMSTGPSPSSTTCVSPPRNGCGGRRRRARTARGARPARARARGRRLRRRRLPCDDGRWSPTPCHRPDDPSSDDRRMGGSAQTSCRSYAYAVAAERFETPSLAKRLLKCRATVFSLITRLRRDRRGSSVRVRRGGSPRPRAQSGRRPHAWRGRAERHAELRKRPRAPPPPRAAAASSSPSARHGGCRSTAARASLVVRRPDAAPEPARVPKRDERGPVVACARLRDGRRLPRLRRRRARRGVRLRAPRARARRLVGGIDVTGREHDLDERGEERRHAASRAAARSAERPGGWRPTAADGFPLRRAGAARDRVRLPSRAGWPRGRRERPSASSPRSRWISPTR